MVAGASTQGTPSVESGGLLDTPEAGPAAVRGGVLRVIGYAGGVLLTVASAALMFRHLGVADGGRYVTVLAVASVVAGATEIGLTTIGMRELSVRPDAEAHTFMRSLLGLRLTLSLGGAALAVAFAAIAGYDQVMVVGTALASTAVVVTAIQGTLGISLMVGLRLGSLTLLELGRQALTAAVIVLLVELDGDLLAFLAAGIPAGAVVLVATAWLVRHQVPLIPGFHPGEWKAVLRDVLPFAAATIVASIYFRAAMIAVSLVSTEAQTGYFGASFRIAEVLLLVPGLVVGAAFPIFARAARDDRQRLAYGVDRVFRAMVLLGGALMVVMVVGAPFAIEVVAGPQFSESAPVLRLHGIALAFAFLNAVPFYALLSLSRHRTLLYLASFGLLVNLLLAVWLASVWGAQGAATATLVAEVLALGTGLLALRWAGIAVSPGTGFVVRALVAIAAGLAAGLLTGLPIVVATALAVTVFGVACLLLKIVPEELLQILPRQFGAAKRANASE